MSVNGVGAAQGALGGAGTGAMIGSAVPGIGTAAGAIGGGIIGGIAGLFSSNGNDDAAQAQADAAKYATNVQYQEFQQQQANQQPWLAAGKTALSQLGTMASQAPSFTAQDFQNNMDPAYQFDLQQGQQALERSAAARGGLQSGGTLKDLTNYAQGAASNEYQNAYNRFMNNQNTQFNRLSSIAGLGQTANGQLGQAGQNMANNVGENAMGAANAQGAAAIANSQAWGNTLSSLGTGGMNWAMQSQMLNRFAPQAPAGYGAGADLGYGSSIGAASQPYQYQSSPGSYSLLAGE